MAFKVYSHINITTLKPDTPKLKPDTEFWLEHRSNDRIVLMARRSSRVITEVLSVDPDGVALHVIKEDVGIRTVNQKPNLKPENEKQEGSGIEYVEQVYSDAEECPDSGQMLVATTGCSNFKCQKWEGDKRVVPKLVERDGYEVCPVCNGSYGPVE